MSARAAVAKILLALAALVGASVASDGARACGDIAEPCLVPLGRYVAAQRPSMDREPRRLMIHFHGAGGSGARVFNDDRIMVERFLAQGWVVIAPDGLPRPPRGPGWNFREGETVTRDDLVFTLQIVDDAVARFNVDRDKVLLSGFSIGGSLVWMLACRAPDKFAAFAPVAGGFWRPHPQDCAGPVNLLHVHGWRDAVVPLEGRIFRRERVFQQGDIMEGFALWRRVNGCDTQAPSAIDVTPLWWGREWNACASGARLDLIMHPGGHEIPDFWPKMAMDWFQQVIARRITRH